MVPCNVISPFEEERITKVYTLDGSRFLFKKKGGMVMSLGVELNMRAPFFHG
jgi:hypothetical protein